MTPGPDPRFATWSDLEAAARAKLPARIWDYIEGGAGEEATLRANREAFRRRTLRPRMLRDVRYVELASTLLGRRVSAPVVVAPTAYHGSIHPDGERATARGAAAAGVAAAFSTLSTDSMESIAAASDAGVRWFQLYLQPAPGMTERLVERAEKAGYHALVVTVDAPVLAGRDRQQRSGFALDAPEPMGNGPDVVSPGRGPIPDGTGFRFREETGATWATIRALAGTTKLPMVVKGLLTAEDARAAVRAGARGIVVSNHGGRQLDGAPASLDALPEVVAEVGSEIEVFVDGGVRRGSDMVTALALGARAVGVGRPVLWGLAVDGAAGVERVLQMMRSELAVALALAGCRSPSEVDGALLATPAPAGRPPRRPRGAGRQAIRYGRGTLARHRRP